ncbi:nickel-dependent lactate racemase [Neomoorella humiferrea]|uniref:nickel-dependent lactate racemase n=1 Tax=Neomoorella humiferrea TaxID=676965 RepID=UPI003D8D1DEB
MQEHIIPYARQKVLVDLPDNWKVTNIKCTKKPLTTEDIKKKLTSPIGCSALKDIVRPNDTVAIIIEDHTRCTPISEIISFLIEELNSSGIKDEDIVIVGATAAHRKMKQSDFNNKLGPDITRRIRVESHDPFGEVEYFGTTSRGTPVWINKTVAEAKIKIGIGGIAPHGSVGFSGGAKLILPGVAGFTTISYNHTQIDQSVSIGTGLDRPMRLDMEEAANLVGLNFIVAGLIDMDLRLVDLVAGDPFKAHRAGAQRAKDLYEVKIENEADLVIACSYPLDLDFFQSGKGLFPAASFVKEGGVILWICGCQEGLGCHYLVQQDRVYKQGLLSAFESVCSKATVIFVSDNLEYEEIKEYLPDKIIFEKRLEKGLCKAIHMLPDTATATILYSSPYTIGVK